MSQYQQLYDRIAEATRAATGISEIAPGRPANVNQVLPRATVSLIMVKREGSGRGVICTWVWAIDVEVGLKTDGTDPQQYLAGMAFAVVDELTPYTETQGDIPPAAAPFGGVGFSPYVTSVEPILFELQNRAIGFALAFEVKTMQWQ